MSSAAKAVLGTTAAASGAAALLYGAPRLWSALNQFRTQLERAKEVGRRRDGAARPSRRMRANWNARPIAAAV